MRSVKKLSALAQTYGEPTSKGVKIGLHLCQKELATLVGTSQESINKQLAVWQAEGLVSMEHGDPTIWLVTELESLAGKQADRKPSATVFS